MIDRNRGHILRAVAPVLLLAAVACGQWQRVGGEAPDNTGEVVPQLFDVTSLYRSMGLVAAPQPIQFVAGFDFFAGPSPDTTLVTLGLSLPNTALTFRRAGGGYEARYSVDVRVQRGDTTLRELSVTETVHVADLEGTRRADESVVFQQYGTLTPGEAVMRVSVRDRYGTGASHTVDTLVVPRFGDEASFSSLTPIYDGQPRPNRGMIPDIVVNPRSTVSYGSDTLRLYMEAYGLEGGTPVTLRASVIEQGVQELWADTVVLTALGAIPVLLVTIPPERLQMGQVLFHASTQDGAVAASVNTLVAFSQEWVVSNFDETLSLLRYFGPDGAMQALRDAPIEERPALWKAFWDATDPAPTTAENEAMTEYFKRLQSANRMFSEPSKPGWLTDRGEVYISLGQADQTFDQSGQVQGSEGVRYIHWEYIGARISLIFWDRNGFGHFELTPESRQAFTEAVSRLKRRG